MELLLWRSAPKPGAARVPTAVLSTLCGRLLPQAEACSGTTEDRALLLVSCGYSS
jgi:hypothetical protein